MPLLRALSLLLTAIWLAGTAAVAVAGELWITGPAGAELEIDGRSMGFLPLEEPLELGPGRHELRCRLGGHRDYRDELWLEGPEDSLFLRVQMLPLSRLRSVGYSALLAGWGQHYQGRSTRGWTMMGLELGAVGMAVFGEIRFGSKRDDYEAALEDYQRAISPTEITRLRDEAQSSYDDMESAETLRNAAWTAAAVVVVWSVVDAWLGLDDVTLEARPRSDEMRVAWSLPF